MTDFGFEVTQTSPDAPRALRLRGALTVQTLLRLESVLADHAGQGALTLDLSDVGHMDTAGAWSVVRWSERHGAQVTGLEARLQSLLDTVAAAMPRPDPPEPAPRGLREMLEGVGRGVVGAGRFLTELAAYLGVFLARLGRAARHPSEFRLTSLVHHCQDVGLRAVPIVALMGFLIGIVLAFQGSVQLRQFGAEVFVVELIAISILRELGILLTAIIVAGRTASAFTAAIGSMKMREEIDAMRTLGIDPAMVLFVPRILALLITLPILGLIANIAGFVGGAMMAWAELGISPWMFYVRLTEEISIDHAIVGFSKAPVFAVIIGVIGCHAGMRVESNTESLGRMTSAAVVSAIFAVIAADALFSVFFARVGI
ncbi:MlaE family lipid ABC transporter permease subunit [Rhodobacteraceae bacterium 2376]|uniref:MlaE family lipid ABC transporter permease subunit n=1 Tax=Rhabdonatronobacter sediminivivens TaxID=2743469 RepID=A0A7Z0HZ80_9RHOB|nr:MlaE family lipid ABC transporter permease subunit [Rhabdonatronobacter sediminivivens]NYS24584.1 MlaE family lipid ABC transporter permease subunit [Rhabdonatronobacter sediminivivens]